MVWSSPAGSIFALRLRPYEEECRFHLVDTRLPPGVWFYFLLEHRKMVWSSSAFALLSLAAAATATATLSDSYNETLTSTSFNLNEANKNLWLSAAGLNPSFFIYPFMILHHFSLLWCI
jgi:hypothetical protein